MREPELPIAADLIARAATRICSAMIELVPNDSPVYSRYQSAQANLPKVADASFDKPPPDFTGRDWVFAAIAAWLVRPSTPIMLVVGASGSGKTALASRLVTAADQHTSLAGGLRPRAASWSWRIPAVSTMAGVRSWRSWCGPSRCAGRPMSPRPGAP